MNSIENEKLQQMNTPNGGYRLKEAVKVVSDQVTSTKGALA